MLNLTAHAQWTEELKFIPATVNWNMVNIAAVVPNFDGERISAKSIIC